MKYSLDSDAIINAWRDYPIQNFPKIWQWIESLGIEEIGGMSEVVFKELERGGDECFEWFKKRRDYFIHPSDQTIQAEVQRLVTYYNNFGLTTGKNEGDPYVVALAIVKNAVVVTNESPSNDMNGPKIPDICRAEDIYRIKFVEVITKEGIIFS